MGLTVPLRFLGNVIRGFRAVGVQGCHESGRYGGKKIGGDQGLVQSFLGNMRETPYRGPFLLLALLNGLYPQMVP